MSTSRLTGFSPPAILRSITALAGGEMLARAVAFAGTAVLARRLGPDTFGILGFATAICSYLVLAVSGGMQAIGSREVARAPDRAVGLYLSVSSARLVLACFAFTLLAVAANFLPRPHTTQLVVLLSGLSLFSLAVSPGWVFRGLERPSLAALGLVVGPIIYASGVVLAVRGPQDVFLVPLLQFLAEVFVALMLAAVLLRGQRPQFNFGVGLKLLFSSRFIALGEVFRTMVISADVILLGFMTSDHAVGLYSAAYRFTFVLMSVVAAIGSAYLPSYSRVVTSGPEQARRLIETSLGIAATIGAPLVAGSIMVAPQLMSLFFGPDYAEGAAVFRILAGSVGFLFLHWSSSNVLIALHKTRLQAVIHAIAAAMNVGLNVFLIPRYGIIGSAWAMVVSELSTAVIGFDVMRRLGLLPSLRVLMPPIFAAGGMSVALWLISTRASFMETVTLGGLVYLTLLGCLRGLPPRTVS